MGQKNDTINMDAILTTFLNTLQIIMISTWATIFLEIIYQMLNHKVQVEYQLILKSLKYFFRLKKLIDNVCQYCVLYNLLCSNSPAIYFSLCQFTCCHLPVFMLINLLTYFKGNCYWYYCTSQFKCANVHVFMSNGEWAYSTYESLTWDKKYGISAYSIYMSLSPHFHAHACMQGNYVFLWWPACQSG